MAVSVFAWTGWRSYEKLQSG